MEQPEFKHGEILYYLGNGKIEEGTVQHILYIDEQYMYGFTKYLKDKSKIDLYSFNFRDKPKDIFDLGIVERSKLFKTREELIKSL